MLQINNIRKTYQTGELVQKALDGVNLSLRDSEFVAILGPSGSGKTTLLNIIGGLDRYDSGDLIINGVSTKQYRDRDWDAYRNHSIGFVFQSYNLIPHQSILSNVELALTISGVRRGERRRRAQEALERVGLGDQLHKRPNQLSGGQMQRVAIARALVNDPAILLADEPTGALDSDTSVQVMDLLREVAKDRLVVMVTHNAELAEQYATRIVRLRDGRITDDTNPFDSLQAAPPENRSPGRASMSFATAIALSFNNLRSKLGRTILTAFAGSIGIIGIALILSMSNGVDRYIESVEENTLKNYPLEITDSSFDLASLYTGNRGEGNPDAEVSEWKTVSNLFSRVTSNDLGALRTFFEGEGREIYRYAQAIEYGYAVTPQIYALEGDGSVRQINPDSSFSAMGFSSSEGMSSMFSAFSSTDSFRPMPAEESLYLEQYDLKAGHWPENYNECVLVLTVGGRIADITLYVLGVKDPAELDALVGAFTNGTPVEISEDAGEYRYDDFIGLEYRLIHSADYYVYDETYGVWTDRSGDAAFLRTLAEAGETLRIVGVVQLKDGQDSGCLTTGVCYPASLAAHLIEYAAQSEIVQAQLAQPDRNVFTGLPFGEDAETDALQLGTIFTVDPDAMTEYFSFDADTLRAELPTPDLSSLQLSDFSLDLSSLSLTAPALDTAQLAQLLDGLELNLTEEQMSALFSKLLEGYAAYAQSDPATDYTQLPDAVGSFLQSDLAREELNGFLTAALAQAGANTITAEQLAQIVERVMAGYPVYLEANGLSEAEVGYQYLSAYLQSDVARALLTESANELQAQLTAALPSQEQFTALAEQLLTDYSLYAQENALPQPDRIGQSFGAYLQTPEAKELLMEAITDAIDTEALQQRVGAMFSGYAASMEQQLSAVMSQLMGKLVSQLSAAIAQSMGSMAEALSENLLSAFTLDPETLAQAFTMNMDMGQLRDLITALLSDETTSYRGNLKKLGYIAPEEPSSISIYPIDFDSKRTIKQILADYNDRQRAEGHEERVIIYTDMVDTLMHSVTQIVDAISIVLIAFVAVSLIVSSIMIGIITYISVLERTKEIGILRAIGASKRNISNVFNAETFLIGLFAGIMGVGITLLLLIPINILLAELTGIAEVKAILPIVGAVVLVVLSMLLTLTAGLIPSRKAAKKDPVTALRTE